MISVQALKYTKRNLGPINLSIGAGEFLWLCGPSGSGKSTFCDLLCRNLEPTGGQVKADEDSAVGYLAQDFENQLLGATIEQELEFSRRAAGGCPEPAGVTKLLERFRGRESVDPRILSAGEQQLLLLACLMIARFRLLVLDETLSRLNAPEMALVCDSLKELVNTGVSVVLVSHQVRTLPYADRVLILEGGLLSFDGAVSDIGLELLERAQVWTGLCSDDLLWERCSSGPNSGPCNWTFHQEPWSVQSGEALVLLGASGSGKSRFLAALAGLANFDGLVFESGVVFAYLRERAHSALQKRSVEQELMASHLFGGDPGTSWTETLVGSLIPEDWLARNPRSLSQGQTRFLVLACLVIQKPELLLLDEPFAGLDATLRGRASKMIRFYLQGGGRLVMTSHDPDEIALWGETLMVLRDSRAVWKGRRADFRWASWSDFLKLPLGLDPEYSVLLGREMKLDMTSPNL